MTIDSVEIINKNYITDERGWFLKMITGDENENDFKGEVYITSAKPGETKGGHYHKEAKEWFCLIRGKAKLHLKEIKYGEYRSIILDANEPKTIFVPPYIAHEFENTGSQDFIVIAYTNVKYHPDDTVPYKFLNEKS